MGGAVVWAVGVGGGMFGGVGAVGHGTADGIAIGRISVCGSGWES